MDSSKINDYWNDIYLMVKANEATNSSQVDAFFSRLHPQVISEGFLMLTADTDFIRKWIIDHYLRFIEASLNEYFGMPFSVVVELDTTPKPAPTEKLSDNPASGEVSRQSDVQATKDNGPSRDPQTGRLQDQKAEKENPEEPASESEQRNTVTDQEEERPKAADGKVGSLTFENFVIGESNRLAYSMALDVAEKPGKTHINPLFIFGKSGLGKTHLLRSIQNYIDLTQPYLNTIYVDSADLLNDYTDASAAHDKEKSSFINFKRKYEEADVLLIDDIQNLQGKKQTLEIVFQIFKKYIDQNKQIVLSADRAPKNIDIDERYSSRFNSGGTVDIQPPDFETKLAIVKSFVNDCISQENMNGLTIPQEIQTYIAENSSSNIRELKGAVTTVIYHMTHLDNPNISINDVKALLDHSLTGGFARTLTVDDVIKAVTEFFKVSKTDLLSKKRSQNIAYPRQVAMYLSRELLDLPQTAIGEKFRRDHSTVNHSVAVMEEKISKYTETREQIEYLKQVIREE